VFSIAYQLRNPSFCLGFAFLNNSVLSFLDSFWGCFVPYKWPWIHNLCADGRDCSFTKNRNSVLQLSVKTMV